MVGRVLPRKVEHLARLYHRSPAKGCAGETTNRFWLLLTIKQPKWGRIRADKMRRLSDGVPPRAVTRDIGGSRYPHLDRIHQLAVGLGEPA
jgi:hypothetical protein